MRKRIVIVVNTTEFVVKAKNLALEKANDMGLIGAEYLPVAPQIAKIIWHDVDNNTTAGLTAIAEQAAAAIEQIPMVKTVKFYVM